MEAGRHAGRSARHHEPQALTRFANNEIHQNVAEEDTRRQPALRRRSAGRRGLRQSPRRRRPRAPRAAALPRRRGCSRPRTDFVSLPGRGPRRSSPGAYAPATAEADPEDRADAAAAVIAAAEAVGGRGLRLRADEQRGGLRRELPGHPRQPSHDSRAQVLTVMMGPGGGTGYAEQVAVDFSAIDASAIGREAAERTKAMRDPIELPAGDYPVVLEQLRRRRPRRLAGLPGLLGTRGPGGPLLLRAGQARGLGARHHQRRRHRPGRHAGLLRLRGRAHAARDARRRGRLPGRRPRHPDGAAGRRRSTGHGLPAPNP